MKQLDPVTVEVIQNRLVQITKEAGITLQRTAGSPTVALTKDVGFNIADHKGRNIVYSIWMPRHGTTLGWMLRSTLARFGEGGIGKGDMILCNNPYDGALHLLDLALLAPVYYGDELVAWAGCATHHLDIRAMHPGLCCDSTEWFQEGIVFRPIKLVDGGRLREDIFDFFIDNVRVPQIQALDLKGQIASVNVAVDRIQQTAHRYGVETLKACYDTIIDFSRAKAIERIKRIPDGDYDATDYIDFDKTYTIHRRLTVKGRYSHF